MGNYRKKPIVIQATQWWENGDYPNESHADEEGRVVRFFRHPELPGDSACTYCQQPLHVHGWIDTIEGGLRVCPGDWIITGIHGERYPCKPDIFDATYEAVT